MIWKDQPVEKEIEEINSKIGTVPSGKTVEGQITELNSNMIYLNGSTNAITDANDIPKTGIYKAVNSTANTPSAGHFTIYHIEYTNEEKTQLAIATNSGKLYTRVYYNNAWSTWSEK